MPDYEKLTVIKLRDELVARGLARTGLKAALVQRLVEADAQTEKAESAKSENSERSQEGDSVTRTASCVPQALSELNGSEPAADGAPQSGEPDKDGLKLTDVEGKNARLQEPDEMGQAHNRILEVEEDEQIEEQAPDSLGKPYGYVLSPNGTHNEQNTEAQSEKAEEPELQSPAPNQTYTGEVKTAEDKAGVVTQTLLTSEETLEDTRKRKRRSQSPTPSSMESTQKRLKANHGRPIVELPEDSTAVRTDQQDRPSDISSRSNLGRAKESDIQTNGHKCSDEEIQLVGKSTSIVIGEAAAEESRQSQADFSALEELAPPKERIATPTHVKSVESPMKSSPSDTRFKNLFTAPTNQEPASRKSHYPNNEEGMVSPALHPATSALYIRELMRPLKIESFRDHLIALATPPNTAVSEDILTDFYLDSIRTHCLVGFQNISAASRVRSGLHNQIWPSERDRRQLWVDFVPEEKLKNWIDVERTAGTAGNGRGHPSKRWEVVYVDEGNGIQAYLQEAGSNGGDLRTVRSPRLDGGQSLQVAGSRNHESEPRSSQPRLDSGSGFRALDDLFTSTKAKPKLYYLPVPKAEADRRLAKLAAGRGRGRGDEMRRFSFEEGSIVDNGPEFERGGNGRRGGHSGSYRGRGRGYRTDASRGDSWRERRWGH